MKKTKMDLNLEDPKNLKSGKEANPSGGTRKVTSQANPPEEAGKEGSPRRRGMKRFLLLGGTGLLVFCGMAGIGIYLGWVKIPGMSSPKAAIPRPVQSLDIGPMVKMAPLIINLNEENGRHYIKATLVLETAGEVVEEVKSKLPSLTDMVILMLGDKKLEELRSADAKENLRRELLEKANRVVPEGKIKGIYFDEFLFQ